MKSAAVAEVFRIKVLSPAGYGRGSARVPVVYATDSDELFGGLATLAFGLQASGKTRPFILVAVGYERSRLAELLRLRDFLTDSIRVRLRGVVVATANSLSDGAGDQLPDVMRTTGAREFLRFLCEELMPFIAKNYPVLPERTSYFGYSAGATFGLYTLFNEPQTFTAYVLGSPSTSYEGSHFGIEMAKEFLATGRSIGAQVFISVGELEELGEDRGKFDLVTGYYRMVKFLRESRNPRLLEARVFPKETHATAWSQAFAQGLKWILRPDGVADR